MWDCHVCRSPYATGSVLESYDVAKRTSRLIRVEPTSRLCISRAGLVLRPEFEYDFDEKAGARERQY